MSVLFTLDPQKALAKLRVPDEDFKEIRKTLNQFKRKSDGGNKATDRIMENIKQKLSDSVALVVAFLYDDLVASVPRDSIWLAHNFEHSSGRFPSTLVIPTPARGPYPRGPMFDEPNDINPASIDGRNKQYVYNTAEYADEYVGLDEEGGAGMDTVIANFESGLYLRRALKATGWKSR